MGTGDLIRTTRKARNLTQKQLGELSGIAEPTIRRYELGKLNPKYETLQRIAKALGISVLQLIPATAPDLDFKAVCDVLDSIDLCIESAEWGNGTDADEDYYYIWHKDTETPKENRVRYTFRNLSQLVASVQRDAEIAAVLWKRNFIRDELEKELFVERYHAASVSESTPSVREDEDTTPATDSPEMPPESK